MERRFFMIGGLAATAYSTTGCIPLLSIVFRGGLARFAVRSFASRGVGLLGVAARGVGSSVHISRLASFGTGKTSIINSSGRVLGVARTSGSQVSLEKGGAQLTYTAVRPNGRSLHFLPNNRQLGSSYSRGKGRIDHYDARGKLSAYDKIDRNGTTVEHYTANRQRTGTTRIDQESGRVQLRPNSSLEQFLNEIIAIDDGVCSSAQDELRAWQRADASCSAENGSCEAVRTKLLAYQNALKNCG